MPRFLIEVAHEGTKRDCARAVDVFFRTGSHFLTHADWGCNDGEHKAWLIIDVASKDEARSVVPPEFRDRAKITGLNTFSRADLAAIQKRHGG